LGKKLTRSDLITMLCARGVSQRKAKRSVRAFFDAMTAALARQEPVEWPFGALEVRRNRKSFCRSREKAHLCSPSWVPLVFNRDPFRVVINPQSNDAHPKGRT
jgi:nucleoid DNA-binding protein